MITHNLPSKVLSVPSPRGKHNSVSRKSCHHAYPQISNFIANIFSKALLPLFAGFYSPLKHSFVK